MLLQRLIAEFRDENWFYPIFLAELPQIEETHGTEENHGFSPMFSGIGNVAQLHLRSLLLVGGHERSAAAEPVQPLAVSLDPADPNHIEQLIEVMVFFGSVSRCARGLIGYLKPERPYLLRLGGDGAEQIFEKMHRAERNLNLMLSRNGGQHGVAVVVKADHLTGIETGEVFDERERLFCRKTRFSKVNVADAAK